MKKASLKRKLKRIPAFFKRIGLHNKNFTIISNNCWGGGIYDLYALRYNTPTIGLYFMSYDYIKFLKNLDEYLKNELIQVKWSDTPFRNEFFQQKDVYKNSLNKELDDLVIAKLSDIYIIFLHYDTFEEAKDKWNRRVKRINKENMVVKFNDQNEFKKEYFDLFDKLSYKHKIFYTGDKTIKSQYGTKVIYLNEPYIKNKVVLTDMIYSKQNFNLKQYLNEL
ncbi:DUF1919 domain-containing protein [Ligilactobacillus agilis]|uniref:DUF1919 domain-containing protein n=1 Tax=Ligilactobacillus agilis TaxID=1601 RepID=A0A9Q9MUM1_9LACO|nr:DUF1919 domain-containing protein [Ligilactobacillus agilis]UXC62734.1 DUF1919 domain-containing protein [Ligilactobacillus agilis]UXC64733.1 DUF1919 domain-containing protein [Ligilactobacillus agilis]